MDGCMDGWLHPQLETEDSNSNLEVVRANV